MKDAYIASLESNAKILEDFVLKMTDEEISRKIKEYWTIRDHVEHLASSQVALLARMRQFIEEENPVMKPFRPADDSRGEPRARTVRALLDEFALMRERQIRLIRDAGDEVWRKRATHPEYARYDFEIVVRHAIFHDGFHLWRMEELWNRKEDLIAESV